MHRYITLVNYTVRIAVLVKQEDFRFEDFIECHIHHFQYFFAQNRLKNFSSNMHIREGISYTVYAMHIGALQLQK